MSQIKDEVVLVTGATGSNGTEIVRRLASRHVRRRAMLRHPAETLVRIGEAQKAAGILLAEYGGTDSRRRAGARSIIRGANDPRPFVAMLVTEMRDQDGGRRDQVLLTSLLIAPPEAVSSALNSWDSACKGDFSASH